LKTNHIPGQTSQRHIPHNQLVHKAINPVNRSILENNTIIANIINIMFTKIHILLALYQSRPPAA